jgi:hypothetical protein
MLLTITVSWYFWMKLSTSDLGMRQWGLVPLPSVCPTQLEPLRGNDKTRVDGCRGLNISASNLLMKPHRAQRIGDMSLLP